MRQTHDRRDHVPAIFARNGDHRHGTGIKAFYPRAFGKQQIKPSQHQMMIAHLPDPCGGPRARTKFGTMAGTDQASLQAGQANRVLGRQKQRRLIANGTGRKPDGGQGWGRVQDRQSKDPGGRARSPAPHVLPQSTPNPPPLCLAQAARRAAWRFGCPRQSTAHPSQTANRCWQRSWRRRPAKQRFPALETSAARCRGRHLSPQHPRRAQGCHRGGSDHRHPVDRPYGRRAA